MNSHALDRWFDRSLSPFRDMSMAEPFDRFFNDIFNFKKLSSGQEFDFCPSCDVIEEDKKYLLKFDLPGVDKKDLKVEVNGDMLTVSAERKEEKNIDKKKKHMSELHYGSYYRTFKLPGSMTEKDVDAKFENGVLTLTVPKTESESEAKTKQIPIK